MRRSMSGRVARKIGAYDDEHSSSGESSAPDAPKDSPVKRPTFGKSKKRSSMRISFGPGDLGDDAGGSTPVITPKKSNLSRIAMEKNAEIRARSPLVNDLPRASVDEDRPTYSKDYLAELKNSTPSTPKDLMPSAEEEEEARTLDITSKFGPTATLTPTPEPFSFIPTEAEIQEKKARRARLAKEQGAYDEDPKEQPWATDDSEDEFRQNRGEISLRPKDKYPETRLIHEDEDIAEGFEEYVEDGNIALGRKAEREMEKRRRAEMAEMINQAERGSDDDGTADSEEERNAAYEAAQTRAGIGRKAAQEKDDGTRTPPKITPLPDLGEVLQRLQNDVRDKEQRRAMILQKMEEIKEEKLRIADRQKYLQEQLQKTGEEYEKLRLEAGMAAVPVNGNEEGKVIVNRGLDSMGTTPVVGRGLDSLGSTPTPMSGVEVAEDEE